MYGDKTRELLALINKIARPLTGNNIAFWLGWDNLITRAALARLVRLKKIHREKVDGINYYRGLQ